MHASESELSKELKKWQWNVSRPSGYRPKLWIKTVKILFRSIKSIQNRLAYLNFNAIFEFLGQLIYYNMQILFFKDMLIILR